MKLGMIDLGSNSARMYLLSYEEGEFRYLARRRVMCRLSEGMDRDGMLKEPAMARTVAVLGEFAKELAKEDAVPFAVATAAVRKANNRLAFLERVEKGTGIRIFVIDGNLEAYLDFQGVLASLPWMQDCLICDTGGGSTELILCKNRQLKGRISLPFGAMTLTERYGQRLEDGKEEVRLELAQIPFLQEAKGLPLVGIGGSVCALYGLSRPEREAVPNGYTVERAKAEEIFRRLYPLTPEERMAEGVEPGRADTICGGLFPAMVLLEDLEMPSVTLSLGGLREGMMAELKKGNLEYDVQNPAEFFEKYLDSMT